MFLEGTVIIDQCMLVQLTLYIILAMIQQLADMHDIWPTMHRAHCCTDKTVTNCTVTDQHNSFPFKTRSSYDMILAQDYPVIITKICTETTALLALSRYNTMLLSVQEYSGW